MAITATAFRPHASFRHEALLWAEETELLAGVVPFVAEGLEAGQPVLVALLGVHNALVRHALGPNGHQATFVDVETTSTNPTLMVDAAREFLGASPAAHPVRIVGEPIWPGRPTAEIAECQLMEAMLNITIEPDRAAWFLCCYDTSGLAADVLAQAQRTHPVLVEGGAYRGSPRYGGRSEVDDLFSRALADPPESAASLVVPAECQAALDAVIARSGTAGIAEDKIDRLGAAIRDLVATGLGDRLRVWTEPDALVCQLDDRWPTTDPTTGHRPHELAGSRGHALAAAHRVLDLVQVRSTAEGTSVRMFARRD